MALSQEAAYVLGGALCLLLLRLLGVGLSLRLRPHDRDHRLDWADWVAAVRFNAIDQFVMANTSAEAMVRHAALSSGS
jgi:hypothetical protein